MKNVVVLGSTGSVGTQTLDVISQHPDSLRVVGLAAGSNERTLREQAERFGVGRLALFSETGVGGLVGLATGDDVDIVVVSVAGVIGLLPTLRAIQAGKRIALASKEVLVAAGELVMREAKASGVDIVPVDSEHSAIFQCLQGSRHGQIKSLILTASGGPFRGVPKREVLAATAKEALRHPTWTMGGKITIDSATLMNKALEMIEARWLFGVEPADIEVVVHPQSIIHSMVRFQDGSVLGQLGFPDMRLPISYALHYPERRQNPLKMWSPLDSPTLTFEAVDEETFPSLQLARTAMEKGGTTPAAFNAANEEAANAFLRNEIGIGDIWETVQRTMDEGWPDHASLEAVLEADERARRFARNLMSGLSRNANSSDSI